MSYWRVKYFGRWQYQSL